MKLCWINFSFSLQTEKTARPWRLLHTPVSQLGWPWHSRNMEWQKTRSKEEHWTVSPRDISSVHVLNSLGQRTRIIGSVTVWHKATFMEVEAEHPNTSFEQVNKKKELAWSPSGWRGRNETSWAGAASHLVSREVPVQLKCLAEQLMHGVWKSPPSLKCLHKHHSSPLHPETDSPDKEQAPASQGCHPAATQHSTGNLKHQAPYGRGPEPNDILL